MKERRGTCSACGEERAVTAKGNVRQHFVLGEYGFRLAAECPGVGKPPSAMAEDPAVAAEARGYQKAIDALRAEAAQSLDRITEAGADSAMWDLYDSAADWLETVREDHVPASTLHEGGTAREI